MGIIVLHWKLLRVISEHFQSHFRANSGPCRFPLETSKSNFRAIDSANIKPAATKSTHNIKFIKLNPTDLIGLVATGEISITGRGPPPGMSPEEHRAETPRPRAGEAGEHSISLKNPRGIPIGRNPRCILNVFDRAANRWRGERQGSPRTSCWPHQCGIGPLTAIIDDISWRN